jgi:hypothetical protein
MQTNIANIIVTVIFIIIFKYFYFLDTFVHAIQLLFLI